MDGIGIIRMIALGLTVQEARLEILVNGSVVRPACAFEAMYCPQTLNLEESK